MKYAEDLPRVKFVSGIKSVFVFLHHDANSTELIVKLSGLTLD